MINTAVTVQIDTGIKIDVSIIQWIKATALSTILGPILDGAGCQWAIEVVTKLVLLQGRQLLNSLLNFMSEGTVLSIEKLQVISLC